MPLYMLNDAEIALLKQVLDKVLGQPIPSGGRQPPTFEDHQAPGTYIAWPPSGGIPALVSIGSAGPGGGEDVPGSATCDIFKIDDSGIPELIAITGLDKTVYNLSHTIIPQEWIIVTLTKGGKWVVIEAMGDALPDGDTTNDMLYWDETGTAGGEWKILEAPSPSGDFALTVSNGVLAWTSISAFACP